MNDSTSSNHRIDRIEVKNGAIGRFFVLWVPLTMRLQQEDATKVRKK
jgi:hypothetical protein